MPTPGPVHWHQGLFLQPHHLQHLQRHVADVVADERRLAWAYPYGVVEASLAPDALENMLVRFERLRAVMPSGVEVNVPHSAELPSLDIKAAYEATAAPLTILLGVPLYYPARANVIEPGSREDWRVKRLYRAVEVQRADENTGEDAQPMLVRKVNARLLLESDDRTDLETIPLMRIVHAAGKDSAVPVQDPAFIPPCLVLSAWPPLRDLVRSLVDQVEARRRSVVVQLTRGGFNIEAIRGVQIEQLLRLTTLNRFSGRLPSMVAAPGVSPFEVYLELRELLGELAALRPDRDQFEAVRYDHDNPAVAFNEVAGKIRRLLGEDIPRSFREVKFAPDGGVLAATLTDDDLSLPNDYFLGIRTGQDSRAVAALVENGELFKLMPWTLREKFVYGVKLAEERHPPTELPAQVGLHYYRLLRGESARMWDRIREEKKAAIRWPDMETSDFRISLFMTVPAPTA